MLPSTLTGKFYTKINLLEQNMVQLRSPDIENLSIYGLSCQIHLCLWRKKQTTTTTTTTPPPTPTPKFGNTNTTTTTNNNNNNPTSLRWGLQYSYMQMYSPCLSFLVKIDLTWHCQIRLLLTLWRKSEFCSTKFQVIIMNLYSVRISDDIRRFWMFFFF